MLCDESSAIVALVPAFQTALTALKAKIAEIDETEEQSSLSIAGISADKKNFKEAACTNTVDIAGMVYAYAVATTNQTLKQEVKLSPTKLRRTGDAAFAPFCQAVHDRAFEHKTALADYGVTDELLLNLQKSINDFASAAPKPRTAIGKRKTRRTSLIQLFRELDEILNERMDALMGKFRTSHPEFYQTYFNLREIVDPSTTVTQLKGRVTDAVTGSPVKGAVITIVESGKTAKTDSSGEYTIKPADHGKVTVRVTAQDYAPFENDEIEIKLGDIRHLDEALVKLD